MFRVFDNETADGVWSDVAATLLCSDVVLQQGRGGLTREIMHAALSIRDPRQRWIGSRHPAMNPAFAIAEVIWMIRGRQDSAFLNFFNKDLPKFAGKGQTYHGAYGFRLRHHFGIDQIERAYQALRANKDSRQVVLQIWDSRIDLPYADGQSAASDIPCNVVAFLKVRGQKLEWTQSMRSNDLFRGLPHNIIQFTSLQEIIAGWLDLEVGHYHHYSDSLHMYSSDGYANPILTPTKTPRNMESLSLPKAQSEAAFSILAEYVEKIIDPRTVPEMIVSDAKHEQLPQPFVNLALIIGAEALRRRGNMRLMESMIHQCTNQCLKFMFTRYVARMNPKAVSAQSI